MRYLASTAWASAKVVRSGTVGPEPITPGSSLGTSEISHDSTRAGWAAMARRPPLMAERCFRTVFISTMLAPDFSSARLTACLSARVRPGAGSASSAEAPPEIRQSTRSSARQSLHLLEDAAARRRGLSRRARDAPPRRSRSSCRPRHSRSASPPGPRADAASWSSTARAMAALALPAPITMVLPFGGCSLAMWGARQVAGRAAASAASNRSRSRARASASFICAIFAL